MDLPDPNRYRQSIVNKVNKSTIDIDYLTNEIQTLVGDSTLGLPFIKLSLNHLGEAQVRNIANYVCRKARSPGRAFVSICKKELTKKGY